MADINKLKKLASLIRYYIVISTSEAGSGHPTSSLSATELMTVLFFGGFFRFDPDNKDHPNMIELFFLRVMHLLYFMPYGPLQEN